MSCRPGNVRVENLASHKQIECNAVVLLVSFEPVQVVFAIVLVVQRPHVVVVVVAVLLLLNLAMLVVVVVPFGALVECLGQGMPT